MSLEKLLFIVEVQLKNLLNSQLPFLAKKTFGHAGTFSINPLSFVIVTLLYCIGYGYPDFLSDE